MTEFHSGLGLASWARGILLVSVVSMVVDPQSPAHAQEADTRIQLSETEIVETIPGTVSLTETGRRSWGLSETDWKTYTDLMSGSAGLWYPHLAPAFVLGLYAESDAERDRFARIVYDQERRRLDQLFEFNRAYQRIARVERAETGFGYFGDFDSSGKLTVPSISGNASYRILAFVGPDCPGCVQAVRKLVDTGRSFDIYYVGAGSNREISRWARDAGLPASRIRNRSITLNHDAGALARTGLVMSDLPVLFSDPSLNTTLSLETVLAGGGQ